MILVVYRNYLPLQFQRNPIKEGRCFEMSKLQGNANVSNVIQVLEHKLVLLMPDSFSHFFLSSPCHFLPMYKVTVQDWDSEVKSIDAEEFTKRR